MIFFLIILSVSEKCIAVVSPNVVIIIFFFCKKSEIINLIFLIVCGSSVYKYNGSSNDLRNVFIFPNSI